MTTMELPTLDDVICKLQELAEVDSIDPDVPVTDIGVDSLDLLEWSYTVEDAYGVNIEESVLDSIDPEDTLRSVYTKVMDVLRSQLP